MLTTDECGGSSTFLLKIIKCLCEQNAANSDDEDAHYGPNVTYTVVCEALVKCFVFILISFQDVYYVPRSWHIFSCFAVAQVTQTTC